MSQILERPPWRLTPPDPAFLTAPQKDENGNIDKPALLIKTSQMRRALIWPQLCPAVRAAPYQMEWLVE